jgi:hypothetical protein
VTHQVSEWLTEDIIDEGVTCALKLALGERPEFEAIGVARRSEVVDSPRLSGRFSALNMVDSLRSLWSILRVHFG